MLFVVCVLLVAGSLFTIFSIILYAVHVIIKKERDVLKINKKERQFEPYTDEMLYRCKKIPLIYRFIQRFVSIIVASVASLFSLPIMAYILIVKLSRKQKVFRTRFVNGYKHKQIHLLRFDTRYNDRFNKFLENTTFEFLPRVINILIGDVNLVGLRIYSSEYENNNAEKLKFVRKLCRPGFTSMSNSLKSYYDGEYCESIIDDLNYLKEYRLKKDFSVLFSTIYYIFAYEWTKRGRIARNKYSD